MQLEKDVGADPRGGQAERTECQPHRTSRRFFGELGGKGVARRGLLFLFAIGRRFQFDRDDRLRGWRKVTRTLPDSSGDTLEVSAEKGYLREFGNLAFHFSLLGLLEVVFGVLWVWLGTEEAPSMAVLGGGALVLGALAANEALALRRVARAT